MPLWIDPLVDKLKYSKKEKVMQAINTTFYSQSPKLWNAYTDVYFRELRFIGPAFFIFFFVAEFR